MADGSASAPRQRRRRTVDERARVFTLGLPDIAQQIGTSVPTPNLPIPFLFLASPPVEVPTLGPLLRGHLDHHRRVTRWIQPDRQRRGCTVHSRRRGPLGLASGGRRGRVGGDHIRRHRGWSLRVTAGREWTAS